MITKTAKYFLSVTIGFYLLLMVSCREEASSFKLTRAIENLTDLDLNVNVYQNGSISETISIASQDKNVSQDKCFSERGSLSICSLDWAISHMDSVVVVFEDFKSLIYCRDVVTDENCSINEKNIMFLSSNNGYMFGDGNTYLFHITQDDYLEAE